MLQMSIKKWGNSPATRLPAALMKAANFKLNDIIDVTDVTVKDNGQIVLTLTPQTPRKKKTYSFKEMMGRVTPDNCHEYVDFGHPVGNEDL